ncbi:MAG: hypothetical protein QFB87_00700 [Patescibacteria group bacterium]|nr:hypothetical protein [Patescibacteria group bacterium]
MLGLTTVFKSITLLAAGPAHCENTFFGLKPWYHYLKLDPTTCDIDRTAFHTLGSNSSFLLIGLAVVDDLLRIAGLLAVGYVIYGGIQYITSQGSPDGTSKAQATVLNALIGLAICLVAIGAVSFAGKALGA